MLDVLNKHLANATNTPMCGFGNWLSTQENNIQEAFSAIAGNKNIKIQNIYNDLVNSGIDLPVKLTVFRSHLKGYCVCQNKN